MSDYPSDLSLNCLYLYSYPLLFKDNSVFFQNFKKLIKTNPNELRYWYAYLDVQFNQIKNYSSENFMILDKIYNQCTNSPILSVWANLKIRLTNQEYCFVMPIVYIAQKMAILN